MGPCLNRAGCVGQQLEHQPSTQKVPSSIPSTITGGKKQRFTDESQKVEYGHIHIMALLVTLWSWHPGRSLPGACLGVGTSPPDSDQFKVEPSNWSVYQGRNRKPKVSQRPQVAFLCPNALPCPAQDSSLPKPLAGQIARGPQQTQSVLSLLRDPTTVAVKCTNTPAAVSVGPASTQVTDHKHLF